MYLIETNARADDVSVIWIDVYAVKRNTSARAFQFVTQTHNKR